MAPPVLALKNARLRIGQQQLFAGLDATLARGDRVCLVGRNGSGKSTLLRVLAGLVDLDAGEAFVQPRVTAAYLPQEPELPAGLPLADLVLRGLSATEDASAARYRAEILLEELGMKPTREAAGLSGGEIRRVSLAQALVGEPEVLLLDEPTNHLDLPAIEWLEERLAAFGGSFVVISHDRRFLTRLSTRTWWLDRGALRSSDQGYVGFEAWREEVLAAEEAEIQRLDKRLEAETHWLHRGVTARRRRNMGRLRQLHDLRRQRRELIPPPGTVKLPAGTPALSGRMVVEAEGIAKAYDDRTVLHPFSTRILRGDRIGILGPNGAGKTTLLKLLTGELAPDTGAVRLGTGLEIARFDQHRAQLDPERSPWEILCPHGGDRVQVRGESRHVVGYLREFLFRDEQARQPVRALSGGERNRLLLALILARPANLLVLDEPTNDLDIETLDLLEEMLADHPGTLLLVSHDRDFVDRLVTSTIVLEEGRAREYAGGYTDWLAQRPAPIAKAPAAPKPIPAPPRNAPRPFPAKLQRELDRLPERMAAVEQEIAALELQLDDPDLYTRDPDGFAFIGEKLASLRGVLAAYEDRWLELEALREAHTA
ncbi:MAG: ABC-F family ATP-binding cassette domain-containing protein [Geminicoccaceae bacterium]